MCYLLDRREPVSKEAILADLWPDRTEQNANLNFRQAVFQLNRTLDRKTIVKRDRRWTLAFDCWVDTREFERLYMEGVQLEDAGDVRAARCAFWRALTYYRGPYLADVDSPWALRRAEEFAVAYHSCLNRLAALEEQLGRYDVAAQRWFQVLASAASHESARRGMIHYYARRQEYENARDQYARLRHELGPDRAPSAETQALYDELMPQATAHDA
jgi:two-component SAPR family response regulator